MEEAVCGIRRTHRAWGGRKIHHRLKNMGKVEVPAPSTITGILRRNGLMEPVEPRPDSGAVGSFEADAPNDLWQVDFKGDFALTDGGRSYPLGVMDDHSRYNLRLVSCADQQTGTVRAHFEAAFDLYGLPTRMLFDNGSPWGTASSDWKWTGLTVWLLDLGIAVSHSRIRHPQTLGKEERFHRTLNLEVLKTRPQWASHTQVQEALDRWRPVYNHQRPHESLDNQVPADRYQPSPRRLPNWIEPPTYPTEWQTRKANRTTSEISWQNQPVKVGKPFRGRTVGIAPPDIDGTITIYYRTTPIRTLHA
jgi:transposase InsO family protein